MNLITTTLELEAFCARQADAAFVTVDTEFLRDKTYWPQLCLVQIGGPHEAAAIDSLAPGIDLGALFALLSNEAILKVFHAARQDVEIFFNLTGKIPTPLFDTQVAAMVCGFGDSVSYETLAGKLAGAKIDKSSRFTDWSHRPLSDRQLEYALADVTHLRKAYEALNAQLKKNHRESWLVDELAILIDPATYQIDPEESWRRLKPRSGNKRFFAVLKEVSKWRELASQQRDLPRSRILRDESLLEIASHAPSSIEELSLVRGLGKSVAEGRLGSDILDAIKSGLALPADRIPTITPRDDLPAGLGPLVDLLRVLLKLRCEESNVAQKLVASSHDLEEIAANDKAPIPALTGWRYDVFGKDAIALKHGNLGLTARGKSILVVDLDGGAVKA